MQYCNAVATIGARQKWLLAWRRDALLEWR
jgi:hypothetical protein